MAKKDQHTPFPHEMWEFVGKELNHTQALLWLAIRKHDWTSQGKGEGCTASQSTLAKMMGMTRPKLNQNIKVLIEKGFVIVAKKADGNKKTNTYWAVIPKAQCSSSGTGHVTPAEHGMLPQGNTVCSSSGTGHVTPAEHKEKEFKNMNLRKEEKKKAVLARLKNKRLPISVVKQELSQEGIGLEDLTDQEMIELFGKFGPMIVKNMVKRTV